MKYKTTALLAVFAVLTAVAVYLFEYKETNDSTANIEQVSRIVTFDPEQINFLEIQKNQNKYVLQKGQEGWSILEPVQDSADNEQVEKLLQTLTEEKHLAIAKESVDPALLNLAEFGLEIPYASFNLKNNLGKSLKVFLGSQKNFEGNSFLRIDSESRILVGTPAWHNKAEQNLMTYREKRLYRSALGAVEGIRIQSLRDSFEISRVSGVWVSKAQPKLMLDQNKVREMLRQIAESSIQEYVIDGEPSASSLAEKKLSDAPVKVHFQTPKASWSVHVNQSEKDNAVYAVTERPTNLLKIDSTRWELFGNLNLDDLRDRSSQFRFSLNEVSQVYFKSDGIEYQFKKEKDQWKASSIPENTEFSAVELVKMLNAVHDFEVSEFLDGKFKPQVSQAFVGNNMIVLKSVSDSLLLQLNWGPQIKLNKSGEANSYSLARTNLGDVLFAMDDRRLESVDFRRAFKKKEVQ